MVRLSLGSTAHAETSPQTLDGFHYEAIAPIDAIRKTIELNFKLYEPSWGIDLGALDIILEKCFLSCSCGSPFKINRPFRRRPLQVWFSERWDFRHVRRSAELVAFP